MSYTTTNKRGFFALDYWLALIYTYPDLNQILPASFTKISFSLNFSTMILK